MAKMKPDLSSVPRPARSRGARGSGRPPDPPNDGPATTAEPKELSEPQESSPALAFPVVGVGASAGGLEAFRSLLKAVPADTGMAFVLVQHMDPKHESMLHRLLARDTSMPVRQVSDGMLLEPNCVYVIPPDREMSVHRGVLKLVARSTGTMRHMPIDAFLSALAGDQKSRAIGIVLSGIGSDGTKGLQAIKAEGGITFVQDEESSKYPGMPLHALSAGCVDLALPAERIGRELSRLKRHPYLQVSPQAFEAGLPEDLNGGLRKILRLLQSTTGVDFANYKLTTIQRRITRRMPVTKCETLAEYAKFMSENPEEVNALFQDVLIHVTSFFRDPELFQFLKSSLIPRLASAAASGEPLRIWVPGCSSGEELYSIAVILFDALGDAASQARVQIFGTDISEKDVQRARTAIYSESATAEIPPELLRRFFVKVDGGYQVAKSIRDQCIFARHDVSRDPPFSRMDLISCRNVLIYLASGLQKKVLTYLHYALKPDGVLVLGKSEGTSAADHLFLLGERQNNVYSKVASTGRGLSELRVSDDFERPPLQTAVSPMLQPAFNPQKEAERIILNHYAPPGFVVSAGLQVVHFSGDTGPFVKPVPGDASFHLLKIVRAELMMEIRGAIKEAKERAAPVRREAVRFNPNDSASLVDLEVIPLEGRLARDGNFVVLFRNLRPVARGERRVKPPKVRKTAEAGEIERLKRELVSTQDNLRGLVEDHEAATEELRAANEEILSSNEELQSTNEELETAKEELQSSNEELTTLNEELQNRNTELTQTAADLNNVLDTVDVPLVILGNDRRIRHFTRAAARPLNLIPGDVGRAINQIRTNLKVDLDLAATRAIESGRRIEIEVQDESGRWYALRIQPYETGTHRKDGILMAFVDIDTVKRLSTSIVETVKEPVLVLDEQYCVISANPSFYQLFQVKKRDTEKALLFDLGGGQWNSPRLRELLEKVLPEENVIAGFEVEHDFPVVGRKILSINARLLAEREAGMPKILLAIEDVTEQKHTQVALAHSEEELRDLSARLLVSVEDQRKQLARELHVAFGQKLALLSLRAREIEPIIPAQPGLAVQQLRACEDQIKRLAQQMQEYARVLHPAVLSELGLAIALRDECDAYARRTGTSVTFSAEAVPDGLPDDVTLCLFRVTQEALQNIQKHAESNRVTVSLKGTEEEIELRVEDFGKGFDVEATRGKGGLGLISMQERVRLVRGSFLLKTKVGDGTIVEVRVPLRRK